MTWIQTYTGKAFDFEALLRGEPQPICLADIAHALSQKCRFGGHCSIFVSVAEHSVVVSRLVAGHSMAAQRAALLHDAAEAYTGDTSRPMKVLLRQSGDSRLDAIEGLVQAAIFDHFGISISDDEHKAIKHADDQALAWEKEHVLGHGPRDREWAWLPDAPANACVGGWLPLKAKAVFLLECQRLGVAETVGER